MKYTNKEMNNYIKDEMYIVQVWSGEVSDTAYYFDNLDEAMAQAKKCADDARNNNTITVEKTEWNKEKSGYFHEDCIDYIEVIEVKGW